MPSAPECPRNAILASLEPADYRRIAPELSPQPFEIGAILQEVGEPATHIYFPSSGMVSVVTVFEDGDAIEGGTVGREGVVNPLAASVDNVAVARSIVQIAGEGDRIDAATLRGLAEEIPALHLMLQRYVTVAIQQAMQTAACNAVHAVPQRLARWLLLSHDRMDGDEFFLTQEFLAEMLGLRRPSVTVAAGELQRAGHIRYRRGHIEVIDRPGLESMACECYTATRNRIDAFLAGEG